MLRFKKATDTNATTIAPAADPNAPVRIDQIVAHSAMVTSEAKAGLRREWRDLSRTAAKTGTLSPGEADQFALVAKELGLPVKFLADEVEVLRAVDSLEKYTENYVSKCARLESEIETATREIDDAKEVVKQRQIQRARLQSERTALNNSWQRLNFLRSANPRLFSDDLRKALDGRPPITSKEQYEQLGLHRNDA